MSLGPNLLIFNIFVMSKTFHIFESVLSLKKTSVHGHLHYHSSSFVYHLYYLITYHLLYYSDPTTHSPPQTATTIFSLPLSIFDPLYTPLSFMCWPEKIKDHPQFLNI